MNLIQVLILLYIVSMMSVIFLLIYRIFRTSIIRRKTVFLLSFIILLMSVEISIFISSIFRETSILYILPLSIIPIIPLVFSAKVKDEMVEWRKDLITSLTLAATILIDEMAMGYAFSTTFGPIDLNPILAAVSNIAFGVMMAVDALFFLLISKVRRIRDWILFTFASSMAFMPNIFYTYHQYLILFSSVIASILMTINIVLLYLVYTRRMFSLDFQILTLSLASFDFLMMLGLAIYSVTYDISILSIITIISMFSYFVLVLYKLPDKKLIPKFKQIFIFMILVNLAELTMGFGESVLGYVTTQPTEMVMSNMYHIHDHGMMIDFSNPFWWIFPFNPWDVTIDEFNSALMLTNSLPYSLFLASFMLIMYTTMSPFYLIMMGSEMSFLVYDKLRSLRYKSNKALLWAVILGVPIFSVLVPNYTPYYIFGMSGMIFPVEYIPFLTSIAAIIVASIMFGRRAYCGVVCMAAHMYNNSFYDQFRARKSSKVWDYIRLISIIPIFVVFGIYLSNTSIFIHVELGPSDVLMLYGMLTLNYAWWFFYFLTPYFGSYSCVRQGWCGFGSFIGLFNKILFKVKAKNKEVCAKCDVKSCDNACPVKIPVSYDTSTKGYVNRVTCIGCGN
ncbi:MAG: 4Fe-4S ferredoxin, partial [Sulfolobaceae archaeon]